MIDEVRVGKCLVWMLTGSVTIFLLASNQHNIHAISEGLQETIFGSWEWYLVCPHISMMSFVAIVTTCAGTALVIPAASFSSQT